MKITTEIDTKNNIRKHKVIGIFTKSLLLEKLSEIYSNSDFHPNMNTYWDFGSADLISLTIKDTEEIASFVKKHWIPSGQYKSALMAPELLSNLITRKYAKNFTDQASINVRVFKQQEEAFAWLTQSQV